MMAPNAGWMMGVHGGYNDGTQCWLNDGNGMEATMMAPNAG